MKRIITAILAVSMLVSLCACGKKGDKKDTSSVDEVSSAISSQESASETDTNSGKETNTASKGSDSDKDASSKDKDASSKAASSKKADSSKAASKAASSKAASKAASSKAASSKAASSKAASSKATSSKADSSKADSSKASKASFEPSDMKGEWKSVFDGDEISVYDDVNYIGFTYKLEDGGVVYGYVTAEVVDNGECFCLYDNGGVGEGELWRKLYVIDKTPINRLFEGGGCSFTRDGYDVKGNKITDTDSDSDSETDSDSESDSDKVFPDINDYLGVWGSGRCTINIGGNGGNYDVEVNWPGSANVLVEWTYGYSYYDEDSQTIICMDGVKRTYLYNDETDYDVDVEYTEGTAIIEIDSNGNLYWFDQEEMAADGMVFSK